MIGLGSDLGASLQLSEREDFRGLLDAPNAKIMDMKLINVLVEIQDQ